MGIGFGAVASLYMSGAKLRMASLSDVIPVVLCRYLSLTVNQSGGCSLYNRGNLKATESLTYMIC